jgi:hypothetical protein
MGQTMPSKYWLPAILLWFQRSDLHNATEDRAPHRSRNGAVRQVLAPSALVLLSHKRKALLALQQNQLLSMIHVSRGLRWANANWKPVQLALDLD